MVISVSLLMVEIGTIVDEGVVKEVCFLNNARKNVVRCSKLKFIMQYGKNSCKNIL